MMYVSLTSFFMVTRSKATCSLLSFAGMRRPRNRVYTAFSQGSPVLLHLAKGRKDAQLAVFEPNRCDLKLFVQTTAFTTLLAIRGGLPQRGLPVNAGAIVKINLVIAGFTM